MTDDFLGGLLAELTGARSRPYTSWLDALHGVAPHAAHDVTTERQARERWVEIAASVHRHPDTPERTRDVAVRVLEAIAGGIPATDPMETPAPHGDPETP